MSLPPSKRRMAARNENKSQHYLPRLLLLATGKRDKVKTILWRVPPRFKSAQKAPSRTRLPRMHLASKWLPHLALLTLLVPHLLLVQPSSLHRRLITVALPESSQSRLKVITMPEVSTRHRLILTMVTFIATNGKCRTSPILDPLIAKLVGQWPIS